MWSSLGLLAIPIALDPVRLGLNLLLVSRPRPAQNLLLYWVGCTLVSLSLLVIPILVLHLIPSFSWLVHDLANPATAASAVVHYLEIVAGVLVLSVAAFLAVRLRTRQRGRLPRSNSAAEPDAPSRGAQLLTRANAAWESGSPWVALAVGFWAGPNPAMVVFGLTTIVTSGAAIGMQLGAAVVFVVETLAVVELVLLSNLVAPVQTEAFLRRLHHWTRAYRRQILVTMLAVVGLALVAQGLGVL
jgi:Sap, sulfolipid-1-addressing protein